jgi:hypothetical protein
MIAMIFTFTGSGKKLVTVISSEEMISKKVQQMGKKFLE